MASTNDRALQHTMQRQESPGTATAAPLEQDAPVPPLANDAAYYLVLGIGIAGLIWMRRLAQTL